jgi:hypothetical protein
MSALTMPRGLLSCRHGHSAKETAIAFLETALAPRRRTALGLGTCRAQSVGQRAFEPMADLDPHLVLDRRDQQQHAVILLRFAELRKS